MPVPALIFFALPLAAALIIALLARIWQKLGYILSFLTGLVLLGASILMLNAVHKAANNVLVYKVAGLMPPLGINLVFDGLSTLMLVTVNLVGFIAILYSLHYISRYTENWKFYTLFMLMLCGLNGVIVSGDLFNLYVCLEIASIAGYALVAYGTEADDLEASFKYAIMGSVASLFILLGIAIIYGYCSTVNMADIALVLSSRPNGLVVGFISALFIAGFGLKAAMVPFHAWLADAHPSAPAPISAVLSGVFIKTLGIYALCRVLFNILAVSHNVLYILIIAGLLSMAVGALLAFGQRDIKRMLAYSSISQVGYIIFALGIGTPLAILAGLFHLFNHAVAKSLLFLNSGAVEYATGTRDLNKLGGLNKRLTLTGGTSLVGSLSIAGIPPFAGFWSKLFIIIAAIQAGFIGAALFAVLVSILTLIYYLRFQNLAFFGREKFTNIKEVPWNMCLSMLILAVLCIAGGLLLLPMARPFLEKAADVLLLGSNYKDMVFGALI